MTTGSEGQPLWGRIVRYVAAAAVCLFAGAALTAGGQWYWSLIGFCLAFFIILGRRRIFRAGVSRKSDEIVCRYLPWCEGNAYLLNVAVPLIGVAAIAAGDAPGNPAWLPVVGFILLGVTPLFTFSVVRMWRRCFLVITSSTLSIQLAEHRDESIVIPRDRVQAITSRVVANGVSGGSSQVEIVYRNADSDTDRTETVLLGLQFTVESSNLLDALQVWHDGANDSPNDLLDRVEGILRCYRGAPIA